MQRQGGAPRLSAADRYFSLRTAPFRSVEGHCGLVRRQVLRLLFGVALGALPLSRALARSEGNGGGNGNSGNGNSGNGNSGNSNSGNGNSGNGTSGNGNSGSGSSGKDGEKGNKGGEQGETSEETAQDQDRALEAVEEGRALPLSAFLPRIERKFGGRVIDAALREVGKRLLYDLKMLSPGGRVFTVSVDAATGRPSGGIGM
jgi:hypothetical protein